MRCIILPASVVCAPPWYGVVCAPPWCGVVYIELSHAIFRQMSEREEEIKKTEEEKQRQEEEKEEKKDKERCEAEKILRMERPKNLEELLKMDLDTAKIRDIRNIMGKMGVSTHGCVERADLKKKLMDNVPELRIRSIRDEPKPAREKGYHTQSGALFKMSLPSQAMIIFHH